MSRRSAFHREVRLTTAPSYRFDRFRLDAEDRRLLADGAPVELSGRYLDALALLVREPGRLVTKERFLEEVWRGVPVGDEALTQCIRTLRRQLGDDAAAPRFIETVPKHGYRFIAPVEVAATGPTAGPSTGAGPVEGGRAADRISVSHLTAAGAAGGGVAGLAIGLFYGFAAAGRGAEPGVGAVSLLLVMVCLCAVLGLVAGAGVSFGVAAGRLAARPPSLLAVLGGAAGGLATGALGKLIGLDAFNLLFGRSPGEITGAGEGLLIGGALGAASWLAGRREGPRQFERALAAGAVAGGAAGLLVTLAGGRLLGGSLDLLAQGFPESRLRLEPISALFGETGFGPVSRAVTGALEGALFGACVVGALILARRRLAAD